MILSARLEAELLKQKWRLPHSFLREIPHRAQGIIAFVNKKRTLFGHFLVDPTLASPIQVLSILFFFFDIEKQLDTIHFLVFQSKQTVISILTCRNFIEGD
jgi:hypothetical protein